MWVGDMGEVGMSSTCSCYVKVLQVPNKDKCICTSSMPQGR